MDRMTKEENTSREIKSENIPGAKALLLLYSYVRIVRPRRSTKTSIYIMAPAIKFILELLLFSVTSSCLLLFVLGLISPHRALFWLKGNRTRLRSSLIYALIFLGGLFIANIWFPGTPRTAQTIADEAAFRSKYRKTDEQISKEVFAETGKIYTKGLIKSSVVYTYDALPESMRKLAPESGFLVRDAYTETNYTEIPKRKGYYVQVVLDNKLLAKASASETFKEDDLLDEVKPGNLYGKYRNSFILYNASNAEIRKTEKNMGYALFYIKRDYNIDTICIGPCIEKPARVRINCYQQAIVTDPVEYTF